MWNDADLWDPWEWMNSIHPDVQVRDMEPGVVLGCVDPERRIIWIARGLSDVERRCVLAFELGQLGQGPMPEDPYARWARQRAAEEWAALMLIPTQMFAEAWVDRLDLAEMAAFCRVDVQTFRNRIRAASDAEQDAVMMVIKDTRLSA